MMTTKGMRILSMVAMLCFTAVLAIQPAQAQVALLWDYTQGTTPAEAFELERSLDNGATWTVLQGAAVLSVFPIPATARTVTDLSAVSTGRYCYRLFAANTVYGRSAASNRACFPPPGAPLNLRKR